VSNKEFILYFLEQCWYWFIAYCFVIFMDWYTHEGLDLFRPVLIIAYLVFALILALWERRIRNKEKK
jgi:hypothetical protein